MLTTVRRRTLVLVLALLLGLAGVAVVAPNAAAAGTPAGPARGLLVERDPADPQNLVISWRPPVSSGSSPLDRYLVHVGTDQDTDVSVLDASQTSLSVPGRSWSSRYRVMVATRNAEGLGTDTGWTAVAPAVPSAPNGITGGRVEAEPTSVAIRWSAPDRAGLSPVTGYQVTLRRLSDGVEWRRSVDGSEVIWTGLDLARSYTVSIAATNEQGDGTPGRVFIGNDRPDSPGAVSVLRDPQDPTRVRLAWAAPRYPGIGPVTGYQVGRRSSAKEFWSWGPVVSADQLTATEVLVVERTAEFTVRAVNDRSTSFRVPARVVRPAAAATPVIPASAAVPVTIGASGSTVTVNLHGTLDAGASSLRLRLTPYVGSSFSDSTSAPSGTRRLQFGSVPDGTYLVSVSGVYPDGERLLRAGFVSIGNVGQLTASDWEVVRGRADISGQTVDIVRNGEVRVLDTRDRTTENARFTTTATLHGGSGYGIWVRATKHADGTQSGWSFQVDPGWNNHFILRLWSRDRECSVPLGTPVPFPAGFRPDKPHQVVVSVQGDSFSSTVNGAPAVVVPSLTQAIEASPCRGWSVPHGMRVGMRSWATSSTTFVGSTLVD